MAPKRSAMLDLLTWQYDQAWDLLEAGQAQESFDDCWDLLQNVHLGDVLRAGVHMLLSQNPLTQYKAAHVEECIEITRNMYIGLDLPDEREQRQQNALIQEANKRLTEARQEDAEYEPPNQDNSQDESSAREDDHDSEEEIDQAARQITRIPGETVRVAEHTQNSQAKKHKGATQMICGLSVYLTHPGSNIPQQSSSQPVNRRLSALQPDMTTPPSSQGGQAGPSSGTRKPSTGFRRPS